MKKIKVSGLSLAMIKSDVTVVASATLLYGGCFGLAAILCGKSNHRLTCGFGMGTMAAYFANAFGDDVLDSIGKLVDKAADKIFEEVDDENKG